MLLLGLGYCLSWSNLLHQKLSRSRSPARIMTGLECIGYYNCMVASGYYSSFMMAISRKSSILHQNFFLVLCFVYKLYCSSKFLYPVGVIIYCNTYAGVVALVWRGGSSSIMQIGRGKAQIEAGCHWEVIGIGEPTHDQKWRPIVAVRGCWRSSWIGFPFCWTDVQIWSFCEFKFSLSFHYLLAWQLITESGRSVSHQNFHLKTVREGFPASWS